MMTFFHSFYHVFDYSWFLDDYSKLFEYRIVFLIPLALLIYLGTWNSLFLLISSTVNTLSMAKGPYEESKIKMIYVKKIITGIFLLVADYIIEGILYGGYI